AVRVALQGGEVVEERRDLLLLLALDRLDDALGPVHLLGDRRRPLRVAEDARLLALEPEAGVARVEGRVDEPVRLRREGLDLALALDDHRERRGLHPAEGDDAADPGTAAQRRGPRGVHADEPVGLAARARRPLEVRELPPRAEPLEAVPDRLLRHRADPEPLDRLVDPGELVDVGEDQLPLPPGVARVHDPVDVVALHQLVDLLELLPRLRVARLELELVGHDREVLHAPALELLVVGLRVFQLHEVADREGDDLAVGLPVGVARGLERSWERVHDVPRDRRLLGYHQRLAHEITLASADTFGRRGPAEPALPLHRRLLPPAPARPLPLRGLRDRAPARGRVRPRGRAPLELRPVAARDRDLAAVLRALHGKVGALLAPALVDRARRRGLRGAARRGRPRGARDRAPARPRGQRRRDVPGGDAALEGAAQAPAGRRPDGRSADRARGGRAARAGGALRHRPAR